MRCPAPCPPRTVPRRSRRSTREASLPEEERCGPAASMSAHSQPGPRISRPRHCSPHASSGTAQNADREFVQLVVVKQADPARRRSLAIRHAAATRRPAQRPGSGRPATPRPVPRASRSPSPARTRSPCLAWTPTTSGGRGYCGRSSPVAAAPTSARATSAGGCGDSSAPTTRARRAGDRSRAKRNHQHFSRSDSAGARTKNSQHQSLSSGGCGPWCDSTKSRLARGRLRQVH